MQVYAPQLVPGLGVLGQELGAARRVRTVLHACASHRLLSPGAAGVTMFESCFLVAPSLVHGMGMFCESYFIFSIGNITPIFQTTYKDCYNQYTTCTQSLINAENYIQVCMSCRPPYTSVASARRCPRQPVTHPCCGALQITGIILGEAPAATSCVFHACPVTSSRDAPGSAPFHHAATSSLPWQACC